MWAAGRRPVIKVPLADPKGAASHDIKAMLAASSNPGVIYICNPNNPTGTCTPRKDIEYAVAHAPKDTILMIDEAYIHLCDAPRSLDFVNEGKNVIVLRTFSKLYGMAGIRMGFAVGRPDLLKKMSGSAASTRCRLPRWRRPRQACSMRTWSRRARRRSPGFALRIWHGSRTTATLRRQKATASCSTTPPRQRSWRRSRKGYLYRPHLARVAHPGAHHRGHQRRDEAFQKAFPEVMSSSTAGLVPPRLPGRLAKTPFTHMS